MGRDVVMRAVASAVLQVRACSEGHVLQLEGCCSLLLNCSS